MIKNKGGRPTKYSKELISKVDEYLLQCRDEEYEFHKTRGEKSDSYEEKIKVHLPTIEDYATFINVHVDSINIWEKKHKKFSEALDKIRKEQKKRLLDKSLDGRYNPTIAKLILSANHGMHEKSVLDSNVDLTADF